MKYALLLSLILLPSSLHSQDKTGTLQGKIVDVRGIEPLVGATIILKGTNVGTSCDAQGNFMIVKIPEGIYTIMIMLVGYQEKEIQSVKIETAKVTELYTTLSEASTQLNEIVIVTERDTDTEVSVLAEVRFSQTVANGVSAEQISKTQDADGAQVLKRLPGISIFEDRFVMIRGLGERYNSVLLNGVLAPSTDVDSKAFSFDVLPSSIIDRMIINKSGSYELPGEFAGGTILIYTKNTPAENFTNVSFSTAYRSGTTGDHFNRYQGGRTDWLGFDDGTRKLPNSFPSTAQFQTETNEQSLKLRESATRRLSTTWLPESSRALPDYKLALGIGRRWLVSSHKVISNLTSISYSNTHQTVSDMQRQRYQRFDPILGMSETNYRFHDNASTQQVRVGILHNWALRINSKHKIEFRNFFNQLGSSQTVIRTGSDAGQSQLVKNYSLYYESKRIYAGQLAGYHELLDGKWDINWTLGYGNTHREEPDFRRYISSYAQDLNSYQIPTPSGNNSLDQNARFFSSLTEDNKTVAVNIERRFKRGQKSELDDILVKAGIYTEAKARDFSARIFVFRPTVLFNPVENPQLNNPTPETLFTSSSVAVDKYLLEEGTKGSDHYSASSQLMAGYLGVKLSIEKWNISSGVRVEHNIQRLESVSGNRPVTINNPVLSVLPSVNISYNLTDRMLLRTAYAASVNRPEFREYAPFLYYDFNNRVNVQGNDSLRIPQIHNVDLRWELYPSPEEIISIGFFYKRFNNPIETKISGAANSTANWTTINARFANTYGVELEIRKTLNSFFEHLFLQRISLVLNASYIYNRVNLGNVKTQETNRTMMNQSPYLINTGIYYQDVDRGWQANILYNVVGPRLFYAGDLIGNTPGNYPDAFELPRHQLDFSLAKIIHTHCEFRIGILDILNSPYRFYQDSNRDSKITPNKPDEPVLKYKKGQYVSLGFKYTL